MSEESVAAQMAAFMNSCNETQLKAIRGWLDKNPIAVEGPATTILDTGRPATHPRRRRITQDGSAMRPLNSWMAFRGYVNSGLCGGWKQMDASAFIRCLWRSDPTKNKWAIIAKAYSEIRDTVGRVNIDLKEFLDLVCPELGLVPADAYLEVFGWVTQENDGVRTVHRVANFDATSLHPDILYTNKTSTDLVHFCEQKGFFFKPSVAPTANASGVSLAMVARPATENNVDASVTAGGDSKVVYDDDNFPEKGPLHPRAAVEGQAVLLVIGGSKYPHNDQFQPDDENTLLQFDDALGADFNHFDICNFTMGSCLDFSMYDPEFNTY